MKQNKEKLSTQEELFCRYYSQNTELFGNATLSYAEAYNQNLDELSLENEKDDNGKEIPNSSPYKKAYDYCSMAGSRLIRKDKIQQFIRKCLNELLKDDVVDGELVKLILQNYELPSKIAAIREYNKLKQRITEKTDLTSDGLPIQLVSYYKKPKNE